MGKNLKDYFVRTVSSEISIHQSYEYDSEGKKKPAVYRRQDLSDWAKEYYDKGEDFFYTKAVDPRRPYGLRELCQPEYTYRCLEEFSADELYKLTEVNGDTSDGYHTFDQLYHQRAILFAVIVNSHPELAWKSLRHSDGKYCFNSDGGWFIVGINTPAGPYTYHCETDKYWDLFKCKELEVGEEWDGHCADDVTRLFSLIDNKTEE